MAIKVKVNLPTEENMEALQDRMCFAVAKVILETKSPEYIRALKRQLQQEIEREQRAPLWE